MSQKPGGAINSSSLCSSVSISGGVNLKTCTVPSSQSCGKFLGSAMDCLLELGYRERLPKF